MNNNELAYHALDQMMACGLREVVICPSSRNAPFVMGLKAYPELTIYHWYEERSAAFFAIGRCRAVGRPVAVITTSGTAAGELLPAAMEAHYSGVPLLLVTADRPRRYRGTGAPQAAEQVGLFGKYVSFSVDLSDAERCDLGQWDRLRAAHLNICFDDPLPGPDIARGPQLSFTDPSAPLPSFEPLRIFLQKTAHPLIVVGSLLEKEREPVVQFLIKLNAPTYLEGHSGLRGDERLAHLRIYQGDLLTQAMRTAAYPLDGVVRLGGVPTVRFWRDLENSHIEVFSVSSRPFSGLSRGRLLFADIEKLLPSLPHPPRMLSKEAAGWLAHDRLYSQAKARLFEKETRSEAALIAQLAVRIPSHALVYVGNSLPIREWDLCSDHCHLFTTRGLNGIDGQLSTFLGLCDPNLENWAIVGDLTALYDLAAPWILPQIEAKKINIVIVNNGGGQIFSRLYPNQEAFLNAHQLRFASFADLWGLEYARWNEAVPSEIPEGGRRLIELIPNLEASGRFWQSHRQLCSSSSDALQMNFALS